MKDPSQLILTVSAGLLDCSVVGVKVAYRWRILRVSYVLDRDLFLADQPRQRHLEFSYQGSHR